MTIEAMKQALEALEYGMAYNGWDDLADRTIQAELKANAAITSLRQAIEQAEKQKPVAWMYEVNGAHTILDLFEPPDDAYDEGTLYPLYTPPQLQRQWIGLTEEEMQQACYETFSYDPYVIARAIEAKLKEKNT